MFAAWEFAAQGKRTLIFSTQANWVEGYGKQVVDLCKRGYLASLLEDEASIARALEVGKEWLGEDHPAVACLKAGVAIHHGRLPSPFLREMEALLSDGVLKVIVASPTLSQGLNLNAAVLLVPALYRASEKIKGEEFANVAGRAGRAFVDVEGLIVHVMFDKIDWRKKEWRKLVASAKARTLKSGLIQIVAEILERLSREGVLDRDDAWEYLANTREAWRSPEEEAEVAERLAAGAEYDADGDDDEDGGDDEEETIDEEPLSQIVERLDATVFGLIEALDSDRADLPKLLDEALKGSLWARQIAREGEDVAPLHKKVFEARAGLIWKTIPQLCENPNTPLANQFRRDSSHCMIRPGFLDPESRQDLTELARDGSAAHRLARRANALVLLDDGMSYAAVAKVLLIDDDTVRTWHRLYEEDGIEGLASFGYEGSACRLSDERQNKLKAWITETLPRSTRAIGAWIEKECGIEYQGRSGLIALLHRLGMEHRKPKAVSRKLDPEKQAAFIKAYEDLLKHMGADEALLFGDAVHPTHAVQAGRLLGAEGHQGGRGADQRSPTPEYSRCDRPGDRPDPHPGGGNGGCRQHHHAVDGDRGDVSEQADDSPVSGQCQVPSREAGAGLAGAAGVPDQAALRPRLLSPSQPN